jgi:UDP-N-acetylmuramoyl-L-alanyl-D-glutamate--2,6-diaminopimelate ligase
MRLSEVIRGLEARHLAGPAPDGVDVRAATADSRKAGTGVVFVAVAGTSADGHDFAAAAVEAGAPAVIVERPMPDLGDATVLQVDDAREAIALVSANLHGRPGERLPLVGITGTNGKTTVAWLTTAALEAAGRNVGLLGTVGIRRGGRLAEATHTTPGPEDLQALLAELLDDGSDAAVMEVSSHALDQARVLGCTFAAAAFTGLSRDHLDYHPDMAAYFAAKARLFERHLADGADAVIFVDDPHGLRLHEALAAEGRVRPVAVSIAGAVSKAAGEDAPARLPEGPSVLARSAALSLAGIEAVIGLPDGTRCLLTSPLVGAHNLANLAVAAGLAHAMGVDAGTLGAGLSACPGVPGRLERVADPKRGPGGDRHLFVDYAHTDDALTRVIAALRSLAPPSARLLVVFGCGGDRDRGKRPLMGRAAAAADVAIVTSDNPRSEDPEAIVADILPGLSGARYLVEIDRRAAIELAAGIARPGDVVLVAGKGHETGQTAAGKTRPFDDRTVSREALATVAAGTRPLPPEGGGGSANPAG